MDNIQRMFYFKISKYPKVLFIRADKGNITVTLNINDYNLKTERIFLMLTLI